MKGIVFNVLESYIDEKFGAGVFDKLVEESLPDNIDPFVGPGTYPDEQLFAIVGKALEVKKLELEPVLRDFGKFMFSALAKKYPVFVEPHDNPKDFIKTIDNIIHVEVKKLFPEAVTPKFSFFNDSDKKLSLKYESARKLFALAEGLIDGAGEHYQQPIKVIRKEENLETGYCVFDLEFV